MRLSASNAFVRRFIKELGIVGILVAILVIWVVISIIGFVVKSLFWLGVIGVIAFVVTAAVGAFRGKSITK